MCCIVYSLGNFDASGIHGVSPADGIIVKETFDENTVNSYITLFKWHKIENEDISLIREGGKLFDKVVGIYLIGYTGTFEIPNWPNIFFFGAVSSNFPELPNWRLIQFVNLDSCGVGRYPDWPTLEKLSISDDFNTGIATLPNWPKLTSFTGHQLFNIRQLSRWPQLKYIKLTHMYIVAIPNYPTLETAYISWCDHTASRMLPNWPNVKNVTCDAHMLNMKILPNWPALESLIIRKDGFSNGHIADYTDKEAAPYRIRYNLVNGLLKKRIKRMINKWRNFIGSSTNPY